MTDQSYVLEAQRRHAAVAPWVRTNGSIVVAAPSRQIVHRSRGSDALSPPRDFRELRDTGCGQEEWNHAFGDAQLPRLRDVYDHAESIGYRLNERSRGFRERIEVHRLAWEGLGDIVRPGGASRGPWIDEEMVEPRVVRRAIRTIVPYLVVPDHRDFAHPLMLCIVVNGPTKGTERWIAVERTLDRESEPQRSFLTALDRHLAELGFEVYRVTEGWLRVDPMRAMLTVLRHARVVESAPMLKGECVHSIADYHCASCGHELARIDASDIEELVHPGYDALAPVHAFCVEDAREGQWSNRRRVA